MKRDKKWLRMVMPLMAFIFLSFAQSSFAQDDYPNDNNPNYDNSDEALIQPENDVNYNTFHDELSPYGTWRDYPGYGNVWVCNISGFRPYNSGGHWAYTRFGWTWVSDYDWGWAPFHYGRWAFDNAFGWFWVPGYTWGPAWVSWRNGGDYYGWAPLSPGLSIGINVGVGIPVTSWCFLPHRYMGYRNINSYYVPRERNVTIIRNTTIINNTNVYNNNRYVVGPERRQVERYIGQRIQQQNIYLSNNHSTNRQDRNGIHLFNPGVNRGVVNNGNNVRPDNRQDNIRQQPANGHPVQNSVQQPNAGNNNPAENNRTDRFQQRREERMQGRQPGDQNSNQQDDQQRQQKTQEMRDRMQQQNNDQHTQQAEQQRQQQQDAQRQQQEQQRQQTQQQMEQKRQEQDNQRQQQLQQRQTQMDQQRQQQMQQRQQQMQQQRQQQDMQRQQQMQQRQQQMQQQRNQNSNRPVMQGGGGRRKNG